jgi:hypothetical protein
LLFVLITATGISAIGEARLFDYFRLHLRERLRFRSTSGFAAGNFAVIILAALLVTIVFFKSWESGTATVQPSAISRLMTRFSGRFGHLWQGENTWYIGSYQAQVWARDNTPEDAVFITYRLPWRTISMRRSVNPEAFQGYIYSGSRRAKQFDDDYLAFYGLQNDFQRMGFSELILTENERYAKLDEGDILRLAHQFGGDYIVRVVNQPLNFPEVYRNQQFVIYKLPRVL